MHSTTSGGKKEDTMTKCGDVIASMDERLTKVEIVIANTLEGMDFIEQSIEGSLKDLREQIQDLKEGCQHDKFNKQGV